VLRDLLGSVVGAIIGATLAHMLGHPDFVAVSAIAGAFMGGGIATSLGQRGGPGGPPRPPDGSPR
jgi:uncharacterized protein YcfJ